jgi:2-oxoisovalerate dehydrogenase E1 component alpha subunit
MAEQQFFDDVAAEADDLGHRLREGCKAMPDPQPMSMFDHVFAEETDELRAERKGFAAYLETFTSTPLSTSEGAH